MNKNVKIEETEQGKYTTIKLIPPYGKENIYKYKTDEEYKNKYLSVENLSYYVARNDEDEEDEYLLRALQEERKLCVSFYTRNYENILKMYPETDYNIRCKDIGKDPFREVYVARKGCLSDYYNIDEIDEWYTMKGINLNSRLFEDLCEVEMIDLIYGEYQTSYCVVDFSIKMNFDEFDDSLLAYQNEGVAVTGLLLGYPLESTANLIEALLLLDDRYGWISNKM